MGKSQKHTRESDGDDTKRKKRRMDKIVVEEVVEKNGLEEQDGITDAIQREACIEKQEANEGEFELSREERRKLKKRQKLMAKLASGPSLAFNNDGFEQMLTLGNIREFVLWCLADGTNPGWMMVKNRPMIKSLVVLHVPQFDAAPFIMNPSHVATTPISFADYLHRATAIGSHGKHMTSLRDIFSHVVPIKGPGEKLRLHSPGAAVLNVPVKQKDKKSVIEKGMTLEQCIMSEDDFKENEFVMPVREGATCALPDGWVQAKRRTDLEKQPHSESNVYAVDCEMCITSAGYELARISIVDYRGSLVYDTLVKPENAILDYLTQFSGITASRLDGVKITLQDVQKRMLDLIREDTVLVGHSLQNDLKALKLAHRRVADTSLLYDHTRGRPFRPGLKWLTQRWLNRHIQTANETNVKGGRNDWDGNGHDSFEDAKACIDLLRLKINNGNAFGRFNTDNEPIFTRLARYYKEQGTERVKMAMLDAPAVFKAFSDTGVSQIPCHSDKDVVDQIGSITKTHSFVWARLRGLELAANHGKHDNDDQGGSANISSLWDPTSSISSDAAERMHELIVSLWKSLPQHTILVLISGQGDGRKAVTMYGRYKRYRDLLKTTLMSKIKKEDVFGDEEERELTREVVKARIGVGLFAVKSSNGDVDV